MSLILWIMVIYWIATIAVAYWYGRGAGRSYLSFHLAGRNLNLPVYAFTYMATFTGGGLVMGIATLAYTSGISAQWYAMTQGLAFITACLLIPLLRKFNVVSVSELLGKLFGGAARGLSALITILGMVALTAGQTIGMAGIVTVVTGIPLAYSFWISAIVFIAITAYGGMHSVAWADTFHGITLALGIVIFVPYAVLNSGGWSTLVSPVDSAPAGQFNWFGVGLLQIITWYFMYVMFVSVGQPLVQRVWAARTTKTALWGTFAAGTFVTFFGLFTAAAGLLAFNLAPNIDSKLAFAWVISNTLPPLAAGVLLAAAVAAVMSGADSFLLSGSTAFVNDIYRPLRGENNCTDGELIVVSRLSIVGFGIIAAFVGLSGINIVPVNTMGMALMGAPIFVALIFALWRKTTMNSAVPAIVIGGVAFVIWEFILGEPYSIESAVPTAVAAAVTIFVTSLLSSGRTVDLKGAIEAQEELSRERETAEHQIGTEPRAT